MLNRIAKAFKREKHNVPKPLGTVIINKKGYFVKYRGKIYPLDNPFDFDNSKYMYSTLFNTVYEPGTKLLNRMSNDDKYIDVVETYWATVYNGMKVKGVIKENKFIIKY